MPRLPIVVCCLAALLGSAFLSLPAVAQQVAAERSPASAPAQPVSSAPATTPRSGAPLPASSIGVGTLPQNLSPWGMFASADVVVQAVMIGLAFASVVTWTVWLAKTLELLASMRSARRLLPRLATAGSLREAREACGGARSVVADLVEAAHREGEISIGLAHDGVKERVLSRLERIEAGALRRTTRGTGLLATIGATAPFVGLFGTVWGIMNAFVGISRAQTTNLAVVAPGIAEALLATALGLVAAIPAVVIYNVFARWIAGYRILMGDASAEIMRHVSRDLDRAREPRLRAAE